MDILFLISLIALIFISWIFLAPSPSPVRLANPYRVSKEEAEEIFNLYAPRRWKLYWKVNIPGDCSGPLPISISGSSCLGHTNSQNKHIVVHDFKWATSSPYNSELHILLHEIAHMLHPSCEHDSHWEQEFKKLAEQYHLKIQDIPRMITDGVEYSYMRFY